MAAVEPQNMVEIYLDPKSRKVEIDPAYGDWHFKRGDDFNWLLRLRVGGKGGTDDPLELGSLDYIKFVMREKGRYDGPAYAQAEIGSAAFDGTKKAYSLPISLAGNLLRAYLANLDATSTSFSENGFDCEDASADAGTTTTTTTGGGATTVVVAPNKPATTLPDVEFMGEFEISQGGHVQSSQTFSIWVTRDLIYNAFNTSVYVPPQPPVDWRFTVAMVSEGNVAQGDVFGFFEAQVPLEILGIEVATKQVDATHGFRVQLTDAAGTDLGAGANYYGNVPANTPAVTWLFGSVLSLGTGDKVRAKFKNYTGDSAVGVTVNLLCRQFINTQPSGPIGLPGITDALVTATTNPGTNATAQMVGQQVRFTIPRGDKGDKGEDGTIINSATVTMLASNASPTGSIVGTQLRLGIPQPPTPTAPAVPATVRVQKYVAGATAYSPTSKVVCAQAFTGRGNFAFLIVEFTNSDSLTTGANQNKVVWYVTRSDQPGQRFASGSTAMSGGRTAEVCCTGQDAETSTDEVIYSLCVEGINYKAGVPGDSEKLPGNAVGTRLTIVELGA